MAFMASPLTVRERTVLAMAAVGKTASEIGEILGITERTVQEHIEMVVRKLGADSRENAIAIFMKSSSAGE
jgi:DNA-binding CsgD family transcriptional regulator